MDLDELKNSWDRATNQEEEQHLTPEIIHQVIERKYHAKLKKITYSEFIGIAVCLAAATFIGFNFYRLDTTFLKITGVVAVLTLVALSIISLLSLQSFTEIKDVNKPYAETLKTFATRKLRFYKLQKINVLLSYLLMVATIVLLPKFFTGKDITDSKYFWIFSFTLGYIFLLFYSRWVMKFYKKALTQTEELLLELSDGDNSKTKP